MIPVAVWLASIGLGDLVAGLDGSVASRPRAIISWLTAALTTLLLGGFLGLPPAALVSLVAVTLVTHGAWLWARRPDEWSPERAAWLLIAEMGFVLSMIGSSGAWPDTEASWASEWLRSMPFDLVSSTPGERVVSLVGAVLFLQATSNATVRLLLRVAGNSPVAAQDLRGGRIIGPLERILIFSLALAGQPTAAALVISAKGLLRFPEISREEKSRIHVTTEYFLVGSLSSWLLALAATGYLQL